MASASKKNTPARMSPRQVESEGDEKLVAPRAMVVLPHAPEDAPVSSAATDVAAPLPVMEAQEGLRHALERGLTDSRAAFIKARAAAEETVTAFEVSFAAAKDGALAFNAKVLEALRANADANFDFLKAVFAAKSLSDVVTLQTEFGRTRVETAVSQAKDLSVLAQRAVVEAVEPITERVARSFKIAS
jgi:phasin